MITDQPTDGINSFMIAEDRSLTFEEKKENELGNGEYGVVYRGTFEGNAVAVKVIIKKDSDDSRKKKQKREMEEHFRLDHENVLKLLHVDDSRDKTCLVLELCAATLTQCIAKEYNGPELPPDGIVLYQIANGLHFIHSRNLVHRDVKPDNILISMTTPVQMKLSDFGFVKKTSPRGTFTQSGLKGTLKWMAPEILELMDESSTEYPRGTIQSDTFAAGCVFFYFLTRGTHPFGNISSRIPGNILDNKPVELNQRQQNLQGDDRAFLYDLIGKMIKKIKDRIALPEVIKQLNFFNSTFKLNCKGQFNKFVMSVPGNRGFREYCVCRFHPTEPVFACLIKDKVILLSAKNWSIPFSKWKEMKTKLQPGNFGSPKTLEWNMEGTQLAAIFNENVIVCWSYPSGEILFQKIFNKQMDRIEWNPFRPNLFATCYLRHDSFGKVFLFNSCPVDQRQFHFYTIECEEKIASVQWISANRVAVGLLRGGIEIWEIDESTTSAKIDKRLEHVSVKGGIEDMAWDKRTKCLAACSRNGWMTIWSMDSDQPIHATKVDGDGTCRSLAWRPNGKPTDDEGVDASRKSADNFILVGGLDEGEIVIWTPTAKEKTRILSQHSSRPYNWVNSLSFSFDGRFLASIDRNGKLIIWAMENWEPVYISEEEKSVGPFSWMSSSTDVPDYKLAFDSDGGKIRVVEYIVDQSKIPSKDDDHKRIAKGKETGGEWPIQSDQIAT